MKMSALNGFNVNSIKTLKKKEKAGKRKKG
jgi:hypothetical protein